MTSTPRKTELPWYTQSVNKMSEHLWRLASIMKAFNAARRQSLSQAYYAMKECGLGYKQLAFLTSLFKQLDFFDYM